MPIETLTIDIAGGGSVTASDGTNTYGQCTTATCGYDMPQGTKATLTALPASGWVFGAWSDDCASNDASVDVTLDASRSCGVTFVPAPPPPPPVTVNVAASATPSDAGTVTVSACTAATSCSVDVGTQVTITAAPQNGARFTSWSGDAVCVGSQANPEIVTFAASADTACTANFVIQRTVSVSGVAGCGTSVTIDSCSDPGCACSGDGHSCTADSGSVFALTVTPAPNMGFLGWLDDATGDTSVGRCPTTTALTQTTSQTAMCHASCAPL